MGEIVLFVCFYSMLSLSPLDAHRQSLWTVLSPSLSSPSVRCLRWVSRARQTATFTPEEEDSLSSHKHNRPARYGLFRLLPHSVSCSISPVAHRSHGHTAMRPSSSNKWRNWGPGKQNDLNKVTEPGDGIAWFYSHHSSSSLPLLRLTSTYWVLIMYQALCSENTFIISYFNSWGHNLK